MSGCPHRGCHDKGSLAGTVFMSAPPPSRTGIWTLSPPDSSNRQSRRVASPTRRATTTA